jgi:sulfatase maturation enzyme AslB (radical SAM superfamily)
MPKDVDKTLCKNCNIRYLCAGACMSERYFCNEDITKLVEHTCKLQKMTWHGYLVLFQKIKNLYPKLIDKIANHKLSYENID